MALKKHIIAFGQIATIAAHHIGDPAEHVTRSCIMGLTDITDAQLCAKHVFEKHKEGDAYLFIYSNVDEQSTEYAKAFEQYILVILKGQNIPFTMLEVMERQALNEEVGADLINRHLNHLKFGVKNSHEKRRQKNGYFGLGFFTPGTVVEYMVGYSSHRKPEQLTVASVLSNSALSYCLVSTTYDDVLEMRKSVNIDHVRRIIKHVPGRLKWDEKRSENYREEFFQNETTNWYFDNMPLKHPSQYRTHSPNQLIYLLADELMSEESQLNGEALVDEILALNVFKKQVVNPESEFCRLTLFSINKKRLKQIVRRLINKHLVKLVTAQKEYEDMMNEIYEKDFDYDYGDHPRNNADDDEEGAGDTSFSLTDSQCRERHEGGSHFDPDEERPTTFDIDAADADIEGGINVLLGNGFTDPTIPETDVSLSISQQRLDDSHNLMLDQEAEMERQGIDTFPGIRESEMTQAVVEMESASLKKHPDDFEDITDTEFETMKRDAEAGMQRISEQPVKLRNQAGVSGAFLTTEGAAEWEGGFQINQSRLDPDPALKPSEKRLSAYRDSLAQREVELRDGHIVAPLLTPHSADIEQSLDQEEEEIHSVEKNEFGHPQTYLRSEGKEFPICSQCQCHVMPNRGQGTICDKCAHEVESEQRHDYNEGNLR